MSLPVPTAEDYLWQFQRLLPRGRVWQHGWGTLQAAALLTLMPTWVRLHLRANQLLTDAFPCSTQELLPEWEASLGLPDPCVQPPLATVQQRQAAVCAKFIARGGQSQAYFIEIAKALGYDITIQTFSPFRVGINSTGDRLYGRDWAYAWRIVVDDTSGEITYFRTGQSSAGEPLRSWGILALQCVIANEAPANTIPIWDYQIGSSPWDDGSSLWDDGDSTWDVGVTVNALQRLAA